MSQNIQIKPGKYEDVMPDMSDEEYETLKESIRRNGFDETTPIIVDQDGDILDGHHRFKVCEELGVEPSFITVEDPDIEQAYRVNLARRDLQGGAIRKIVRRYLKNHYDGSRSLEEIAAELGVSSGLVSKAKGEVEESVNPSDREWFTTDEKRQIVLEHSEEHPEDSARQVAQNVEADVSHPTVRKWLDEFEEEAKEEAEEEDEKELAARIVAANFEHPNAGKHFLADEVGCGSKEVDAVLGRLNLGSLEESVKDRARELVDESDDENAPETEGSEDDNTESSSPDTSPSTDGAETGSEDAKDSTDSNGQTDPSTDDNTGESGVNEDSETIPESKTGFVDIPMNDWSQTQLRNGNKTATTRTEPYGQPGDRFEAAGREYELTHIVEVPLHVVAGYFHGQEGCMEKEDFVDIWEEIHYKKGYEPDWLVHLHLFREATDA